MAITTKIQSVDWTRLIRVDGSMSPQAISQAIARTAKEALAEAQTLNTAALGRTPEYETYVDGRLGAREESVRPDGEIVYEFNIGLRADVIQWILDKLRDKAPKLSGRFAQDMDIYADNVLVTDPLQAAEANEIVIVSTVAYARKIEGVRADGETVRKPLSPRAPEGVFEAVATLAAPRFSNIAKVRFTFATPIRSGTHLEEWASGTKQTRPRFQPRTEGREQKRGEWNRRNPAILIRFGRGRDAQR